jgi:hypothetical protein
MNMPKFELVARANWPMRPFTVEWSMQPIVHPRRLLEQGLGDWTTAVHWLGSTKEKENRYDSEQGLGHRSNG